MSPPRLPLAAAGYRPDPSAEFLQWWYFDSDFEDGHRLMVILMPRSIGRIEQDGNGPVPGVLITVTTPAGKNLRARAYLPGEEPRRGPGGILASIGNNVIAEEGGALHLAARAGDLGVDLRFEPWLAPWAPLPGSGGNVWPPLLWATQRRILPGAVFHYASYVPRATVTGRLFAGRRKVAVQGLGYHECGRMNLSVHRVFSRWYWMRLFLGDLTVVCALARCTSLALGAPLRALLVCEGRRPIASIFDPFGSRITHTVLESVRDERSGRERPRRLSVRACPKGLKLDLSLETTFERESLLFEDFFAHHGLRPHWLQHFARVEARIESGGIRRELAGDGILETMLTGSP